MKIAVFSDVHGNLDALKAVLADIESQKVDEVICLGDTVGYGANSAECLDLVLEKSDLVLGGNHEWAISEEGNTDDFHDMAAKAVRVAQKQLLEFGTPEQIKNRKAFLRNLKYSCDFNGRHYVHGSPANPIWDYILPSYFESEWDEKHIEGLFKTFDRFCFCGHSHCPCIITNDFACAWPNQQGDEFELHPDGSFLINVGSVGQPRDGDPRACYVILENDTDLAFRRIPYDIESAQKKILETDGLHPFLAARLTEGN